MAELSDPLARGDALEDILLEAGRLAESDDEAGALRMLLAAEASHPDSATLLCMIGALAADAGADGMAADYFRRCLALDPMEPDVLMAAGAGLAALGDPAAEPPLRLAALTAPDNPMARMHYGAYLARGGMIDAGLDELLAARSLDPADGDIRRHLAVAYLLSGRGGLALEELEAGVANAPDDAELRLTFGLAQIQEGDLTRAAEELYPLAEALPDAGELQALLALAFRSADWEEAAWIALARAENAAEQIDPAWLAEIEDALESGEAVARALLTEELAPTMLRDRLYGGW